MMKDKKVVKLRKNNFFKNSIYIPFILIMATLIILAFSPLFNITEIKVQGNFRLMENSIINVSELKLGQNILRINKNKVKENIKTLSYVDEVKITRKWPNCILISVTEKAELAKIEVFGSNVVIDENGLVLESYSDNSILDIPLIENIEITSYGVNKTLNSDENEKINNILEVLKIFKKNDMLSIVQKIKSDSGIYIYTNDGHVVSIGDINDLEYKLKRLKAVIEKEMEGKYYFDISNVNIHPISKPLWTFTEEKNADEVIE